MPIFKDAFTKRLPAVLWHGSAYNTDHQRTLKPGYLHSHKLVEWDNGESNHFLYATTERDTAIEQGFASAVEHRYRLDRFQSQADTLVIDSPYALTHHDLEQLSVWLYELHPQDDEQWLFNHNASNGLDSEFKTHRVVPWFERTRVELKEWLATKHVIIRKTK